MMLCACPKNKKFVICGYDDRLDAKSLCRLLEFGLTIGTSVIVRAYSMLKKVQLLEVRGYVLSLRCDQTRLVQVQ